MADVNLPALDAGSIVRPRAFKEEDAAGGTKRYTAYGIMPGTLLVDRTVSSLSSGQAAGTTASIVANPERNVFAITPTNDGRLYIASAAGNGFYWPLYAGVTRVLSGADCPRNALFVTGQTVSTALPMAEG